MRLVINKPDLKAFRIAGDLSAFERRKVGAQDECRRPWSFAQLSCLSFPCTFCSPVKKQFSLAHLACLFPQFLNVLEFKDLHGHEPAPYSHQFEFWTRSLQLSNLLFQVIYTNYSHNACFFLVHFTTLCPRSTLSWYSQMLLASSWNISVTLVTHLSLPSTPFCLYILSTLEPIVHAELCVWTLVTFVVSCGQFTFPGVWTMQYRIC